MGGAPAELEGACGVELPAGVWGCGRAGAPGADCVHGQGGGGGAGRYVGQRGRGWVLRILPTTWTGAEGGVGGAAEGVA